MARRIHIKGVRRREIDSQLLAFVYFQEGKRLRRLRLEREAQEKAKRRERQTHGERRGEHHER
jgi:uncharacterized protein YdaU (DUF1376 family)